MVALTRAEQARLNTDRRRQLEQERAAQGLCGRCGKEPAKSGCKAGEKCLTRVQTRVAKRTTKLRAEGLCACGDKLAPGFKKCEGCRQVNRVDLKQRYDDRKAHGICAGCAAEPAKRGHVVGVKCLQRAARNYQKRQLRLRMQQLADQRKFELRRRLHNPACIERLAKLILGQADPQPSTRRGGAACSQIS